MERTRKITHPKTGDFLRERNALRRGGDWRTRSLGLKSMPPACFLRPAGRRPIRVRVPRKNQDTPHGVSWFLVETGGLEPSTSCV